MEKTLQGRRIIVFGGTGAVGKPVCIALRDAGALPTAAAHGYAGLASLKDEGIPGILWDVTRPTRGFQSLSIDAEFDGFIYAVGRCPPGAADVEISHPLAYLGTNSRIREDFGLHVEGLVGTFQVLRPFLHRGSDIVVVSSAITQIPRERPRPPFLHCASYAAAKAAQDTMTWWIRDEHPEFRVHRIAPSAINTSFFYGSKLPQSPKLAVSEVVDEIVACFTADEAVDKFLVAEE